MSSSTPVHLYRYDLTGGIARSMSPMLMGRQIEGIWHTSIVVFGCEFFFDGGVGITRATQPGATRFGRPYRTELLGSTTKTESVFMAWVLQRQRDGFGPNEYNLLENNCNHFSQAACQFLLDRDIPEDIRDMIPMLLDTPLGRMIRPTLEQAVGGGGTSSLSSTELPPSQPVMAGTPAVTKATTSTASAGIGAGLLSPATGLSDDQQDDLVLATTMLESVVELDDGRSPNSVEAALTAISTLRNVLVNIMSSPREAKYRSLAVSSATYAKKLAPFEEFGVAEVLTCAGFKRVRTDGSNDHTNSGRGSASEEERWVLADQDASTDVLAAIVDALDETTTNIETSAAVAQSLTNEDEEGREVIAARNESRVKESSQGRGKTGRVTSGDVAQNNTANAMTIALAPMPQQPSCKVSRHDDSDTLRFCSPPFPDGFTPLRVGTEGGAPLYSLYVPPVESSGVASGMLSALYRRGRGMTDAEGCFGKCRWGDGGRHVEAYYCSPDGKEKHLSDGYTILCVHRCHSSHSGVPQEEMTSTHTNGGDDDGDGALLWVPAPLLSDPALTGGGDVHAFVFHPSESSRFGVARAPVGSGVHPGVREPAGRCVVPYGGRAVNVTAVAEVLCLRRRVPTALALKVDGLAIGEALLASMDAAEGTPLGSFDALLSWDATRARAGLMARRAAPITPLRARFDSASHSARASAHQHGDGSAPSSQPRLLICHDMGGGYGDGERGGAFVNFSNLAAATTFASDRTCARGRWETMLDRVYTISYWRYVDIFCYFLHQRVAVPPRAWIEAAHRHGVPAIGTIITEGTAGAADLQHMLKDPTRMGRVISRLAEMCDVNGFDGYLLNIENPVDAPLAKRLVMFADGLRKRIKEVRPDGLVIWYDAVTIDGALVYQNALTSRNKPFFDVSDGIFTNYFWNPMHLASSRAAATNRPFDVYVGVDVYGRNMFGGGRYNTHAATREALRSGLSVALFAPAWTLGEESHGSRENFLRAECRLWSRLQADLPHRPLAFTLCPPGTIATNRNERNCHSSRGNYKSYDAPALWSSFATGAATHFFINGTKVVAGAACGGYCQLDAAHLLPPFQFEEQAAISAGTTAAPASPLSARQQDDKPSSPFASVSLPSVVCEGWTLRLPLIANAGRVHGGHAQARWRTDCAWFGDQSLFMTIPPSGAVVVMDACIAVANASEAVWDVVVDLALLVESDASATSASVDTPAMPALALRANTLLSASHTPNGSTTTARPLLCTSSGARVVSHQHYNEQRIVSGGDSHFSWQIVRFNLSAAAALASSFSTFSPTGERVEQHGQVLEVNGLSLLNTGGSTALTCTLGGLAVHMVPGVSEGSNNSSSSSSPLMARGPYTWPCFTLHTTRRGSESVLQLHKVSDALQAVATVPGAPIPSQPQQQQQQQGVPAGQERSVAVVATVHEATTSPPTTSTKGSESRGVFLGTYRVAPDCDTIFTRLHTHSDSPVYSVVVTDVQFYMIEAGY